MLLDGQRLEQELATDRGLFYGDGLFTTFAIEQGRALNWPRHRQRLQAGCAALGMGALDTPRLDAEVAQLSNGIARGVGKCIVTRGSGGRGYRPPPAAVPRRLLYLYPWPDYAPAYARDGVRLHLCQRRLCRQPPPLAGMKHLNRLEQVLARQEWHDPALAEGLLRDEQGYVVEGTMSNVLFVRAGRLYTPLLRDYGVAGIIRALIVELAAAWGIPCEEGYYPLSALLAADEVLLCNSLFGIWPVRDLAQRQWPPGPLTRRLQRHLITHHHIVDYAEIAKNHC